MRDESFYIRRPGAYLISGGKRQDAVQKLVLSAWASVIGTLMVPHRVTGWLTRWVDQAVDAAFRLLTRGVADYRRRDRVLAAQAAAILLAVAIGAFSTSSIPFIQQIGVAVATGALLDAFVVRSLLVPSLMALLGKWNWWSPRPVRRLHRSIAPAEARPAAGRATLLA